MEDFYSPAGLDAIFRQIWIDLAHGALKAGHPFHTPALASHGHKGPDARTVVLRDTDLTRRRLLCHTDIRSPKVSDLQSNPRVAWLFYDHIRDTQLRLHGRVEIFHEDELARARWKLSSSRSRVCYRTTLAPGTPSNTPLAPSMSDSGFRNFAVIDCRVDSIDWLFLHHQGHLRAQFLWREGHWEQQWVAP